MSAVTLVFVRHGQTTGNRDDVLQGCSVDFPLTEKGRWEANRVGQALKHVQWDAVMSSDLGRAMDTCRIMMQEASKGGGKEQIPQPVALLREISYGVREGLPRSMGVEEARAIVSRERGVDVSEVVDNAETSEDVYSRQQEFLKQLREVVAPFLPGGACKVLCVSHGGFIKRFLHSFASCGSIEKIHNCAISAVKVYWREGGGLDDEEPTPIITVDSDSHLNSIDHIRGGEVDSDSKGLKCPFI